MTGCHRIYLASAGTGKTYRLSGRMLDLLLAGCEPRSILATTFTRKAAEEIFGRVLARLVEMVDGPEPRQDLARIRDFGGEFGADQAMALLISLVRGLDRFEVRTLDSFFIHLGRLFSLEADLPARWSMAQGPQADELRAEALTRLLGGVHGPEEELQFVEVLRELTRAGGAVRAIHETLRGLIGDGRAVFLDSDADAWDVVQAPAGPPAADMAALAGRAAQLPVPDTAAGKPRKRWSNAKATLLAALESSDHRRVLDVGIFKKFVEGSDEFDRVPIDQEWRQLLDELKAAVAAEALSHLAVRNQRARDVLARYEALLSRVKRERGLYEFDDIPRALAPREAEGREAITGGDFDLAYRLDATLRHLLLDEFQDTAAVQWRVLAGVAEEICADGTGESSFFCVGDVKQSIYGWRSAEPRLLASMGEHLHIEPAALRDNYRSSSVILDTVDKVFAGIASLPVFAAADEEAPRRAAERFQASYTEHVAARDLPGVAELRQAPAHGDGQKKQDPVLELAVRRVVELTGECPRASIGVLVRSNKVIPPLIAKLQAEGVLVSGHGGNPLTDSAAVLHFLSLLHLADHPADSMAAFHLESSPFPAALGCQDARADAAALSRVVRSRLSEAGVGALCETLSAGVNGHAGYSDWDRRRFRQLGDLAFARGDQLGLRADAFVELVRGHKVEDPAASRIKVMTVHAAKGLEFDAVVLPELHGPLTSNQWTFLSSRPDARERMKIVTLNPGKHIARLDAGLWRLFETQVARAVEEALCVVYVGMTRAKHRLEMLVPAPAKSGRGLTPAAVVCAALAEGRDEEGLLWRHSRSGDVWLPSADERGDGAADAADPPPAAGVASLNLAASDAPRTLPARSPSSEVGGGGVSGAGLLAPRSRAAASRGTLVHMMLERLEWPGGASFDAGALRDVGADVEPDARRRAEAVDYIEQALLADELRAALTPQATGGGEVEVWREREFCVVVDGEDGPTQCRGSFDRVMLWRVEGELARATIQDYKTDAVSGDGVDALVSKYAPQMQAYRAALHAMTGLPLDAISAELLLLTPGLVRSVSAAEAL